MQAEVVAATAAQLVAETMEEHGHAAAFPAEDEWEDAGPEKVLDEETGEEFEAGFFEPTPEPIKLQVVSDDKDDGWDDDDEDDMPELTPEVMLKMFSNLEQHGQTLAPSPKLAEPIQDRSWPTESGIDEDDEDELTPEIMLKMFANLAQHGQTL